MELIVIAILLAVLCGVLGRNRMIGFWGFFFVSLLFTPIIVLLFLFFTTPRPIKVSEEKTN